MNQDPTTHPRGDQARAVPGPDWAPPAAPLDMPRQVLEAERRAASAPSRLLRLFLGWQRA